MIFCVTGLPRSGTAFISTLLNLHPECIAYHELAAYDLQWREAILNSPYEYVSDCSTYAHLSDIHYDKVVYIEYDHERSKERTEIALNKRFTSFENIDRDMREWVFKRDHLNVSREMVFTIDGMKRIWEYLFTDTFPIDRAEVLLRLNIQVHNFAATQFLL